MRSNWITRSAIAAAVAVVLVLVLGCGSGQGGEAGSTVVSGGAFDAAPFGQATYDAEGLAYALQWGEPRKVRRIEVEFAPDSQAPTIDKVRVQYWHRVWDGKPDPILPETGACRAGWTAVDDWTNGKWKDADVRRQGDGRRWTFTFAPTGEKEFPRLGHPGVAFRKTLKVRLVPI